MGEPHDLAGPDLIGRSEEGRPLHVHYAGAAEAPLRVLIVAGQHGDERRARVATEEFAQTFHPAAHGCPRVGLAVIPDLNPDGAARRQRANARGIDLNRDHQLLAAAETRALHHFVRRWRPHLIADVHNYPPRRARLLRHGLIHCHDVFLDTATRPGVPGLLPPLLAALAGRGYRSGRYVLATASGKVRHSTPDVTDARNGLALRYGTPTLLIEGRKPVRGDGPDGRARLLAAVRTALEAMVRWAEENDELLTGPPDAIGAVAIRCRSRRAAGPCTIPFRDALTGEVLPREVPGTFRPRVEATRRVTLPAAYAVPRTHEALLDVLRRHGFPNRPGGAGAVEPVERYRVRSAQRPSRLRVDATSGPQALADYVLFPVTPDGGHALAVHLEPESKYGLHRFADLNLTPPLGSFYPVLRVYSSVL